METHLSGKPAFAHLHVDLRPGESIVAEPNAMASMDAALTMSPRLNGGLFGGIAKGWLGGESLFINEYRNEGKQPARVTLTNSAPGDMLQAELGAGESLCLQPGAYVASTSRVSLGVRWAGFMSGLIAREGFFKLVAKGPGTVWVGAHGALLERDVDGALLVDTGYLVAYPPTMSLKARLAGGIFSSLFSGEGFVTRVEGQGRIVLQSRTIRGLADWINPRLPS